MPGPQIPQSELTRIRKDLDVQNTVGVAIKRQQARELIVPADTNDFDINAQLQGCEIVAIAGELNDGTIVAGVDLEDLVASITAQTFTDKYLVKYGISPTFVDWVGTLAFPAITSDNISITLTGGHNVAYLHVYYLPPAGSTLTGFTDTYDLVADTPLTILHNMGTRARSVQFLNSDNEVIALNWTVDASAPDSQIIVTSGATLNNVTINIIGFNQPE